MTTRRGRATLPADRTDPSATAPTSVLPIRWQITGEPTPAYLALWTRIFTDLGVVAARPDASRPSQGTEDVSDGRQCAGVTADQSRSPERCS